MRRRGAHAEVHLSWTASVPRQVPALRAAIWKVLLGYLPPDAFTWDEARAEIVPLSTPKGARRGARAERLGFRHAFANFWHLRMMPFDACVHRGREGERERGRNNASRVTRLSDSHCRAPLPGKSGA